MQRAGLEKGHLFDARHDVHAIGLREEGQRSIGELGDGPVTHRAVELQGILPRTALDTVGARSPRMMSLPSIPSI